MLALSKLSDSVECSPDACLEVWGREGGGALVAVYPLGGVEEGVMKGGEFSIPMSPFELIRYAYACGSCRSRK